MSRLTHLFRHLSYAAKNNRSSPAWEVYRRAAGLEQQALREELKKQLALLERQLLKLKGTHRDELKFITLQEKILALRRRLLPTRPAP